MVSQEVQNWLWSANIDDLNSLASLINMRRSQIGIGNAIQLAPGDDVYFMSRRYGRLNGKFVRLMRKNAEVRVGMQVWKVPPHMLRKVGDTTSPPPEVADEEG
jgi:hypothetical protein